MLVELGLVVLDLALVVVDLVVVLQVVPLLCCQRFPAGRPSTTRDREVSALRKRRGSVFFVSRAQ